MSTSIFEDSRSLERSKTKELAQILKLDSAVAANVLEADLRLAFRPNNLVRDTKKYSHLSYISGYSSLPTRLTIPLYNRQAITTSIYSGNIHLPIHTTLQLENNSRHVTINGSSHRDILDIIHNATIANTYTFTHTSNYLGIELGQAGGTRHGYIPDTTFISDVATIQQLICHAYSTIEENFITKFCQFNSLSVLLSILPIDIVRAWNRNRDTQSIDKSITEKEYASVYNTILKCGYNYQASIDSWTKNIRSIISTITCVSKYDIPPVSANEADGILGSTGDTAGFTGKILSRYSKNTNKYFSVYHNPLVIPPCIFSLDPVSEYYTIGNLHKAYNGIWCNSELMDMLRVANVPCQEPDICNAAIAANKMQIYHDGIYPVHFSGRLYCPHSILKTRGDTYYDIDDHKFNEDSALLRDVTIESEPLIYPPNSYTTEHLIKFDRYVSVMVRGLMSTYVHLSPNSTRTPYYGTADNMILQTIRVMSSIKCDHAFEDCDSELQKMLVPELIMYKAFLYTIYTMLSGYRTMYEYNRQIDKLDITSATKISDDVLTKVYSKIYDMINLHNIAADNAIRIICKLGIVTNIGIAEDYNCSEDVADITVQKIKDMYNITTTDRFTKLRIDTNRIIACALPEYIEGTQRASSHNTNKYVRFIDMYNHNGVIDIAARFRKGHSNLQEVSSHNILHQSGA